MELSFLQEKEIAIAEAHGLSPQQIRVISSGKLNYIQMSVLRQAMEQGTDLKTVRKAARSKLTPEEMQEMIRNPVIKQKKHQIPIKIWKALPLMLIPAVLFSLLQTVRVMNREKLELKADEISLLCGDTFQPGQYILQYPEGDDLYLPDSFQADIPENRIAVYRTASGVQKILRIRVYDKDEPVIRVNEEPDISDCLGSVVSAYDKTDGDLTDYVSCMVEGNMIVYSVSDSSGNRTEVSRIPAGSETAEEEQIT